MPYTDRSGRMERGRAIGHVPIVESEFVQERLRSYRVHVTESPTGIDNRLVVPAADLGQPGEPVRWALSFDGSPQEVAVREQYPSTRVGYVQVAAVLINLAEMLHQESAHLVDPAAIRALTREALHSVVMPGSNVCRADRASVKESWRAEVFEIFRDYSVEGMSLLEVFDVIVRHSDKQGASGGVILARCSASASCTAHDIEVPMVGGTCAACGGTLYPTDALRIHEEVSEEQSNLMPLGRLMTALEQVTMVAYLHFLARRQPRLLAVVGFVMDGPLAVFGPPAWLHAPIRAFLHAVVNNLHDQHMKAPVVVGIEKTGPFAEHAAAIADHVPPRHVMMLPDSYIYDHVLASRPAVISGYGRDTYYGQKFFYRTATRQVLTITVPKAAGNVTEPFRPEHYGQLPDTLALLDRIGTSLYEDAVIPVALAHSFAAIPLRTGSKVLQVLSRELLGLPAPSGS